MEYNPIIMEDDISVSKLIKVCEGALFKIIDFDENKFRIQGKHNIINVSIDYDKKYIIFYVFQTLAHTDINAAIQISNSVNYEIAVARLSVVMQDNTTILCADYCLPYSSGFVAYHLIKTIEYLNQIMQHVISKHYYGILKG